MSSNRPSNAHPRRNLVRAATSRWNRAHTGVARSHDVITGADGQTRTLADLTVSVTARAGSLGIFPR